MNIAEIAIKYRLVTHVLTALLCVGGWMAFQRMGRLEDPEFTIKDAQVMTEYPGASALEVSEEVTEEIETAIQQMGQLKYVTSTSQEGLSIVQPTMKDKYDRLALPQVWDELRRKVGDVQRKLPPGAKVSLVNDDFGDVYGVFFALYGDGYTYKELKDVADTAAARTAAGSRTWGKSLSTASRPRPSTSRFPGPSSPSWASRPSWSSTPSTARTRSPPPARCGWTATTCGSSPPAPWGRWKTSARC